VIITREQRAQRRDQERFANRAVPHPIPPPIGGLNARDALAEMAETDAVILDNWFCQPSWVEFRRGKQLLATFTGNGETLMGYTGVQTVTPQLFQAVSNGGVYSIYRVDNAGGGAVTVPVVGGAGNTVQQLHSAYFDFNQFGSGSGEFLYALNASGMDLPLLFDGANWAAINTSGGTFQLTNGPGGGSTAGLKTLSQVAVYKQRLWFLQQGSFQIWYLPQLQVGGALTNLNIGADFKLGGYLVAMITVSVDNAAGLNDFMAFCSSEGEVVVYQGYDPAQVSTWSIAAHFTMGHLLAPGRKAWQKIGADALMLTTDGGILISQAMLTDRSQTRQAITDKIRYGINTQIEVYKAAQGWQVQLYPIGNKLIINNPTSNTLSASFAWVQNTLSGGWSTFGLIASSWNAFCYEIWQDKLYHGTAGATYQCDVGTADNGSAITFQVKPAFSQFGQEGKLKRWTMFQPIFQLSGTMSVSLTFNVDFDVTAPTGTVPISNGGSAPWNTSLWNTTFWGDATLISKPWLGISGAGYWGTVNMQMSASLLTCKWMASNFLTEPGGLFYGVG
jgi:hypothetical protein